MSNKKYLQNGQVRKNKMAVNYTRFQIDGIFKVIPQILYQL